MSYEKYKKTGIPLEIKHIGFQDHDPFCHDILTFPQMPQGAKVLCAERDRTDFIKITLIVNPATPSEEKNFLYVEDGTPIEVEMDKLRFIQKFQVFGHDVPRNKKVYRYLFEII